MLQLDLSLPDYLAHPAVGKSDLDLIHRSPAHYKAAKALPEEDTDALRWGRMFHSLVLQPDVFDAQYAVLEEKIDRRTNIGKAAWEEWQEANPGKQAVDRPVMSELRAMRDSIFSHSRAGAAITGRMEVSAFWPLNGGEHQCKCRPDCVNVNGILVDLKTCQDARPEEFSRDCWKYRYHVQAAYYLDGWEEATGEKPSKFLFVAIEKKPPYAVACYLADEGMVRQGRAEYLADLALYEECLATDNWPAYPEIVQEIMLPVWAQEDR